MLEDWAGVAIIVSVQLITFLFIKRRLDRLDESISQLEKAIEEMGMELTEQIAALNTELKEGFVAVKNEPSPCCAKNPSEMATTKNERTR